MRKIPVIFILVLLLLVGFASAAETVVLNGGFEEGFDNEAETVDHWVVSTDAYSIFQVVEESARSGTYGLQIGGSITRPSQSYPSINQSIPLDFENITFYYRVDMLEGSASPNCYLTVYINIDTDYWAEVYEINNPSVGDWVRVDVSKDEITSSNGMEPEDWGSSPVDLIFEVNVSTLNAGDTDFVISLDDINTPDEEPVTPPVGYNSTLVLEVIALVFIFLLSSIWSEENARFGYVIIPLVVAFFWWAGFLPFAYMTTIIPLMIFMGIFSFLRMQAKYKWGFMGTSGGLLFKLVFFLIMLQMVIGYVNGMYLFATPSVSTPDNAATHYTLVEAQAVYGGSSYGINVINMLTAGLLSMWTAFKVLWTMLASVFFIYPTLVTQFHIPVALSLLLQTGIYILYGLELFNMVFKPFKAAEV